MRILSCFLVCLLYLSAAKAQRSDTDWLVLKKNGRSIKTILPGVEFRFMTRDRREYSGLVSRIVHDTLYLRVFDIRMMPTYWGTRTRDTLTTYHVAFPIRNIGYVPRPKRGFEFVRNGTLLMIGGGGYVVLNVVNTATQGGDYDWRGIGIAGGVAAAGYVMSRLNRYWLPLGRKYTLEYISLRDENGKVVQ